MNLLDLPPAVAPRDPLSRQKLLALIERITNQDGTFTALAGEVDILDCSLVAAKRSSHSREAVRASIARSKQKLDEATRLIHARYAWRGYATSASDAFPACEDRCTLTLIAESNSAIVGTMTMGLDGPRGLFADESYSEEVSAVRSQGRRVCELGRLALAEQADTRTVLSTLFGLAYGVGKALQGVTDVFIEVNPRHVGFYRRVFGFGVDAGERFCERVQAPAVLLRTSVDELEARLRAYCSLGATELLKSDRVQPVFT